MGVKALIRVCYDLWCKQKNPSFKSNEMKKTGMTVQTSKELL